MYPRPGEAGVDLTTLPPGTIIEAQTRNTVYTLELGAGRRLRISGHERHCPLPVDVDSLACIDMNGWSRENCIVPEMRIEYRAGTARIQTSRVVSVSIRKPG